MNRTSFSPIASSEGVPFSSITTTALSPTAFSQGVAFSSLTRTALSPMPSGQGVSFSSITSTALSLQQATGVMDRTRIPSSALLQDLLREKKAENRCLRRVSDSRVANGLANGSSSVARRVQSDPLGLLQRKENRPSEAMDGPGPSHIGIREMNEVSDLNLCLREPIPNTRGSMFRSSAKKTSTSNSRSSINVAAPRHLRENWRRP